MSEEPPDLILLDILMPEMDGYQIIKELKSNFKTYDIPVIFITGLEDDINEIYGLELGAVDYITKPFSPGKVNARIKIHIDLKEYRESLEDLAHERAEELTKSNRRIREKIQEQRKLLKSYRLQAEALDVLEDSVLISDSRATVVWVNNAFSILTGYTKDEAENKNLDSFFPDLQKYDFYQNMPDGLMTGKPWEGILEARKKDGGSYEADVKIHALRLTEGNVSHFFIIQRNVRPI
jgi:PAS domain S-box-containing protein